MAADRSAQPVDVLIAGKPVRRTTTHVVATPDRIWSQHRNERAALDALRLRRGGAQFHEMEVLPLQAALARVQGGAA